MTGALVARVEAGSTAWEEGVRPGDRVTAVNGAPLRDIIDYQIACLDEKLMLTVDRSGTVLTVELFQDYSEPLGITFEQPVFNGVKRCANRCVFCFVDQMPPGVRPSLSMKDDDYRLSFLYGNFITLTNLTAVSLARIVEQRLTPLYVSLHSAELDVRAGLMRPYHRDKALENMESLLASGIELHTQVVLCPGINDGVHLDRTIEYLSGLSGILSIGLVPVGLTGHRQGLTPLRPFAPAEAAELVGRVVEWQTAFLADRGSRLVFPADEFYLLSSTAFPEGDEYEDYPQLENGIGIARLFIDEVNGELAGVSGFTGAGRLSALTSVLGGKVLRGVLAAIKAAGGPAIDTVPVNSTYLGGHVGVAGLMAGREVTEAAGKLTGIVLLPDVCLNADALFIDGMSFDEVNRACGGRLRVVPSGGSGFVRSLAEEAA